MGLIEYPDCGKEISDKATNCPDCGRPMKDTEEKRGLPRNVSTVRAKGGAFEGIGALLVIVGILMVLYGVATEAYGKVGFGLVAGFLGFIIFLKSKKRDFLGHIPIIISSIALIISALVGYSSYLKPFELEVKINPESYLQHKKNNLGLYIDASFYNKSPQRGWITNLAVIIYKDSNRYDKYYLALGSFRQTSEKGVFESVESAYENLPIFLEPWQRLCKTMNFLYDVEGDIFPVSPDIYNCELLVWTSDDSKPHIEDFKLEISLDNVDSYKKCREIESTRLVSIRCVGYTPLKSKKLSEEEYNKLH